jgi:hypothetical protein
MRILGLLVPVVSKSLFLLLLMVSLVTAGVSLQSDGLRLEEGTFAPRSELRADVTSLRSDAVEISRQVEDVPKYLRAVWGDFISDWKEISTDASLQVRITARRLNSLVNPNSRPVS